MVDEVQEYISSSRDFLRKAKVYLEEGDLHQASEKGWGAASHMVKAVALTHGVRYESHEEFDQVIYKAMDLLGREDVRRWGDHAHRLHVFYYRRKSLLNMGDIRDRLQGLDSMMNDMEQLALGNHC